MNIDNRLDIEVLLAHVLGVNRSYLYTHPEYQLNAIQKNQFQNLMQRYQQGEPIAYLTGHREFWSLDLMVTRDTLIPRPETELLVECVLELTSNREKISLADLGTGSGAIALALAHEKPNWQIYATDLSNNALNIAEENAKRLNISSVSFHEGVWCAALPSIQLDIIVSNPPYIGEVDSHIQQSVLAYEPHSALIAGEAGLKDLKHIICEAPYYLKLGGYLILEHGFQQAKILRKTFWDVGYTNIVTRHDLSDLERVTLGQWQGKF